MTADLNATRASLQAIRGVGATTFETRCILRSRCSRTIGRGRWCWCFTDGRDTASWLTESAVVDSARRVGVVIHAVRVESDPFLDRLAIEGLEDARGRQPPTASCASCSHARSTRCAPDIC